MRPAAKLLILYPPDRGSKDGAAIAECEFTVFRRDLAARRRRAMSRCQRGTVSGVTIIRRPARRARGITPISAAIGARSAQESFGRAMGWRRRTASWWRSSSISAFFHDSSRRHSHDHAAGRLLIASEHHLRQVLTEYPAALQHRPAAPCPLPAPTGSSNKRPPAINLADYRIRRKQVPGGLIHEYQITA
ncbi:MAG: hypothetical protein ACHQCE_13000 [Streptosporangiales bacterium]